MRMALQAEADKGLQDLFVEEEKKQETEKKILVSTLYIDFLQNVYQGTDFSELLSVL